MRGTGSSAGGFDLVEAGAGNGRLSRDVLEAASRRHPDVYHAIRLHLVERSETARARQRETLAAHQDRVASSSADLPASFEGILFANELLDAFPVHVVQMTRQGLGEVYVDCDGDRLVERLAPPSTPALAAYFGAAGVALEARHARRDQPGRARVDPRGGAGASRAASLSSSTTVTRPPSSTPPPIPRARWPRFTGT